MADPVSAAASMMTLLQLAGSVVRYLNDIRDASKDSGKILVEISSIYGLLFGLKDLAEHPRGDDESRLATLRSLNVSNGPLSQLKSALEQLVAILEPVARSKKVGSLLTWSLKKEKVTDILRLIERYKMLFVLALQKDHMSLSRAIEQDVSEIKSGLARLEISVQSIAQRSREDDKETKILDWLSTFQPEKKHQDVIAQRLAGTGQWLLQRQEFQQWCSDLLCGKPVWCPGIPGAGKTVLSSTVIEHIRSSFLGKNVGIAYFYCDHRDQDHQSILNILATLLRQVSSQRAPLPRPLTELFSRFEKERDQIQLVDLKDAFFDVCQGFDRTFVVVDALDECDASRHRQQILSFLKELETKSINLFVTSRPHLEDIQRAFGTSTQIEIEASQSDIKAYLEDKIDRALDTTELIDTSLKEEILSTIMQNSQGMFLLPVLQIKAILEQTCKAEVREALKFLPRELDDTFEVILARIRAQPRSRCELAMKTLMLISHARRPLQVKELRQALAVVPRDKNLNQDYERSITTVLNSCAGLVAIDSESSTVRLVHFSLQEYLEMERERMYPSGQRDIAEICLTYLLFDAFGSGSCMTETGLEVRLAEYPLLDYAANYWYHHVQRAGDVDTEELALKLLRSEGHLSSATQVGYTSDLPQDGFEVVDYYVRTNGLHIAASLGLRAIVKVLLAEQPKEYIRERDSYGCTPLHRAAANGHVDVVKDLLHTGFDKNAININECTPLHMAAANGHNNVIELLLRSGSKVDSRAWFYWTALHQAANSGHQNTVKLLLQHGANINSRSTRGMTALHRAAGRGHDLIVALLLDHGAEIDVNTWDMWTPLHGAASSGHCSTVTLLLERGATLDLRSSDERTPLHRACRAGHESCARILVAAGADVLNKDHKGWTPLHEAAEKGHISITKHILESDAGIRATQITTRDIHGRTACQVAISSGQYKMARFLREQQCLIHRGVDYMARSPLDFAIESGNEAMVKDLVKEGTDINSRNLDGFTPLHQAAFYGFTDIALLLLDKGVPVNTTSSQGWTLLHSAARAGQVLTLQILLDSGANTKARTVDGHGVLHMACQSGNEACTSILLEQGASVDERDECNGTPLHDAAEYGHCNIVRLLLEAGADPQAIDSEFQNPRRRAIDAGQHATADMLPDVMSPESVWYFRNSGTVLRNNWGVMLCDVGGRHELKNS